MTKESRVKPAKPTEDYPLFPHDSGKWAKKIKGKLVYFGRWGDPAAALLEYQEFLKPQKAQDEATSVLSVADACNHFLSAKRKDRDSGQLAPRSFNDYKRSLKRMAKFFGRERAWSTLMPSDFAAYRAEVLKTCNAISTGNEVVRVKTFINWLVKSKYITGCDVVPDFKKPAAKVVRRHKRLQGKKLYSKDQVRLLLDEAGVHLRAMMLLAINCGYGNNDCNVSVRHHH